MLRSINNINKQSFIDDLSAFKGGLNSRENIFSRFSNGEEVSVSHNKKNRDKIGLKI